MSRKRKGQSANAYPVDKKVTQSLPSIFKIFSRQITRKNGTVNTLDVTIHGTFDTPIFKLQDVVSCMGTDTKNAKRTVRNYKGDSVRICISHNMLLYLFNSYFRCKIGLQS